METESRKLGPRKGDRLNDKQIRAAIRTAPKEGRVMLNDGKGLYLQIHNQVPSWIHRYQLGGEKHRMGLGRYPDIGLAEARDHHTTNRKLLREDVDPLATRNEAVKAEQAVAVAAQMPTVREFAKTRIATMARKWGNPKSETQWTQSLEQLFFAKKIGDVEIGDRPIGTIITTAEMQMILEPLWHEKTVTATRVRGRIEDLYSAAKTLGLYPGENPALWRGNLQNLLPAAKDVHTRVPHPALPYARIPEFIAALRAYSPPANSTVGARGVLAMQLLVLQTSRTNEVLGARKTEINPERRLWTRPASRMKYRSEPHVVPLSRTAMRVIEQAEALCPDSPFLFAGEDPRHPLAPGTLRLLMARLGYGEFDVHGHRASFKTWAEECTNFDKKAIELALAHKLRGDATGEVEQAYMRGELLGTRRVLDAGWAAFCNGVFDTPAWAPYHSPGYGREELEHFDEFGEGAEVIVLPVAKRA